MDTPESHLLDRRAVRLAFGRAAAHYDAAAVLQKEIARRLLERLDYVRLAPSRVLDAGCGTGYALCALRERYPAARLIALDLAEAMLQAAREKAGAWRRLRERWRGAGSAYVCGDLAALPLAPHCCGLIFSNAALQWCNDPPKVFSECLRVLEVGGLFTFSTFGPDTLQELREAFRAADGATHVSRFLDMHDLGDMLSQAGFADPVMDREVLTLTYDTARDMMRDLKAIGGHNATAGRPRGLFGARRWAAMVEALETFRHAGKLPATYEVIYGHAWKPEPKALPDGRAIMRFARRGAATP
ncbi:malonyl-CoA O-methyltransferase [Burkholderiales bacterium]|nr:MAG: malonyl-ACP O-methyltransferase BioC [Burkholderiales bacterium]CAG0961734.1 malonyl-CoA O-methyltransferase [Burkholderiales bacterium]